MKDHRQREQNGALQTARSVDYFINQVTLALMIYRSAYLIANNVTFDGNLPIEIGSGVTLRRPTDAEVETIRLVLQTASGNSHGYWLPYEASITPKEDGSGFIFTRNDNPENWHYYMLSDDEGGSRVHDLEQALLLLEPCIDLSVRVLSEVEGGGQPNRPLGHGGLMPHVIERYHYGVPVRGPRLVLPMANILAAENIRGRLSSLSTSHEFVRYAAKIWQELRRISQSSRLQVIGLFSIIESLVTHSPRLAESLDSISHQLCGKLRLMANRMERKDLLAATFGAVTDTKVWKRLYSFRSAIAHGNAVGFEGEFAILKSNEVVVNFLVVFTRSLLLHALNEPQLFADLKEC